MKKKSTETDDAPILNRIERSSEGQEKILGMLKAENTDAKSLRKAFGLWGSYPLWLELCQSYLNESSSTLVAGRVHVLIFNLNEFHKHATVILMKRAEALGLDSGRIWQSGNYCRELLTKDPAKHYPTTRQDDFWPNCLGGSLYELPVDVRSAIQDGHAQVLRLSIKPGKAETPGTTDTAERTPTDNPRKSQTKIRPWDETVHGTAADAFKSQRRSRPRLTLKDFCHEYCGVKSLKLRPASLEKTLSQNRNKWDKDRKHGGRKRPRTTDT